MAWLKTSTNESSTHSVSVTLCTDALTVTSRMYYVRNLVRLKFHIVTTILYDTIIVEFYLYPTVGTVLIHSVKPELTE